MQQLLTVKKWLESTEERIQQTTTAQCEKRQDSNKTKTVSVQQSID